MRVIGHGIDLTPVDRIASMLARHGDRFRERVFTPGEQRDAVGRRREAEHLAARFAAKEAALKALGTGLSGGIRWTDVEVVRDGLGCPSIRLHGRAAAIASSRGIGSWSVSLTHAGGMAAASVIAMGS